MNRKLDKKARVFVANLLVVASVVGVGSLANQTNAQDAHFNGEKLLIPEVVTRDGRAWSYEMRITGNPDPMGVFPFSTKPVMLMFEFLSLQPATNPYPESPAGYDQDTGYLYVPRIEINGEYFWVLFAPWDIDPPSYQVIDYGEDDWDDDNDGISDAEDPEPWLASSSVDPSGITGRWLFRTEQISDLGGTPCESFQKISYTELEISYDSEEGRYTVSDGTLSVMQDFPIDKRNLWLDASFDVGNGNFETMIGLTIFSSQLLAGSENWNWRGPSGTCENKQSIIHAIKQ